MWSSKKTKDPTFQVGAPPGPDGRVEVHLVDLGSTSLVPTAVLRTGMHSQLSQVSKTEDENQNNSATPKSIYHNRSYFIKFSSTIDLATRCSLPQVPPLAQTFILGDVVPPGGDWSRPALQFVKDAVEGFTCR